MDKFIIMNGRKWIKLSGKYNCFFFVKKMMGVQLWRNKLEVDRKG